MLEDGTRVSAETSRRFACDAGRVVMTHDSEGKILDVGRRRRTSPTAIRRALSYRDENCRFPGCGTKYCEAHHVKHWAAGGRTDLENLVLLCRWHHRSVHEEGYRVQRVGEGEFRFFRPDGKEIPPLPPPAMLAQDPLEVLSIRLVADGVSIDAETGMPTWQGESWDLGWAVYSHRRVKRDDSDS
jgi:hypothetical protein